MKNILKTFNFHFSTIIFILLSFLVGYFKNVICIFLIVIIHEIGHLFFIKLFKYQVTSITIYPFGGITKVSKRINDSIIKERIISLGGIFFQLLLFLIIKLLHLNYDLLLFYNQTILLFNIIPIIPLDGSVFLKSILESHMSYEKALKYTVLISFLIYLLFLFCNIYFQLNNYFICLLLLFQIYTFHKEIATLKNRFYLERYLYNFPYKNIINESTTNYHLLRKNTKHFFYNGKYYESEKTILNSYFADFSRQRDR